MLEFVHPVAAVREPQRTGEVVIDRIAGFLAEARIELRRMALQLDQVPAGGEIRAVAGGMPSGAGGELVAFEEPAVGPAELRQMIKPAATGGTAADDHDAGPIRHGACIASRGNSTLNRPRI